MVSIVMNAASIRRGSIVGAGAIITEGKEFPDHSLTIGAPARVIRTFDGFFKRSAKPAEQSSL